MSFWDLPDLTDDFPQISQANAREASQPSSYYNCVAWAAAETWRNWWPPGGLKGWYWPTWATQDETIAAFIEAFGGLGFVVCDDASYEPGFEKVVLFASADDMPQHMAWQVDADTWASKLGPGHDIHHTLAAVEGGAYGHVRHFLRRPKTPEQIVAANVATL